MTLLNEIASANYSGNERVELHGIFDLDVCAERIRSRPEPPRFVAGHFRYGLHKHLSRPCRYITMLRDPVRRVHSLYHYYRTRSKEWQLHLTNRGYNPEPLGSLQEFLTDGRFRVADNGMVRALSGVGELAPYQSIGERECEQAIRHLDHFTVVGILEQFDASVLLMAQSLGWKKVHYARSNQNRKKPKLTKMSARDRALIEAHTQWDQLLYEAAVQRLEQQIEANDIVGRLHYYQFMNEQLYQPARRVHAWARKAKRKVFSAASLS